MIRTLVTAHPNRQGRVARGALTGLVLVVLALSLVAAPARAGSYIICCPGGGGGGCTQTLVLIDVYANTGGQVLFNGTTPVSNTQYVQLCVGVPYPISPTNIGSPFSFAQWLTNSGTISNPTSASTTFTPSIQFSNPTLVLVLRAPQNYYAPWSGYVATGPAGSSITKISGSFGIPSTSNCAVPCADSGIAYWVGIGGIGKSSSFLQAGLIVCWYWNCQSTTPYYPDFGCTPCYQEFDEAIPAGATSGPIHLNSGFFPGPSFTLTITLSVSNGNSYATIQAGTINTWSDSFSNFVPTETSVEWVAEQTQIAGILLNLPDGATVSFSQPVITAGSQTYYGFLVPIATMNLKDSAGQYLKTTTVAGNNQFTIHRS